jgi:hypothetical protein
MISVAAPASELSVRSLLADGGCSHWGRDRNLRAISWARFVMISVAAPASELSVRSLLADGGCSHWGRD